MQDRLELVSPRQTASPPPVPVGEDDPLTHGGPEYPVGTPRVSNEKFIPIDRSVVLNRLVERLFEPHERREAWEVLSYICALRQARSAALLDELTELYDPFNPDDETLNHYELNGAERREQLAILQEKVEQLIRSANFEKIDDNRLKEILEEESDHGFSAEVDLDEFDFHLLYFRGEMQESRSIRDWKTLWLRKTTYPVDTYRRLFLALKLKPREARIAEIMDRDGVDRAKAEKRVQKARRNLLEGVSEDKLHLKMFRRIARVDMRILFPNARIKFKLFDTLWLWIGSGGSTIFAIVMAILKFLAAVAISLFFIVVTMAGAVGAIVRSITNFFNTRNRYMMKLAQSLYFHNLASNQSVLALINDEAEEEDIKEEALAYCFMLKMPHAFDLHEVDRAVEQFLYDEFGVSFDFDAEDALRRLHNEGLVLQSPNGKLEVASLRDARLLMERRWNRVPLRGAITG